MLGKLMKHEFRATSPMLALICVALLGSAGLTRLLDLLSDEIGLFTLPGTISIILYALVATASMVLVQVLIIRRFWTNVFGDEGYLTLTLPVKRGSILMSKLLVSVIWMAVTMLVLVSSIIIVAMPFLDEQITELFYVLRMVSEYAAELCQTPAWVLFTGLGIYMMIGFFMSVLLFYCSMSLGQLMSGHRLLGSFIGYVVLNGVTRLIMNLFLFTTGFNSALVANYDRFFAFGGLRGYSAFNIRVELIVFLLVNLAITVGLYLLTRLLLRRSLNLQ